MKILDLEDGKKAKRVVIRALMGVPEFEQLGGSLDKLCVFSTKTIREPSSVIKTGARHSYAKYFLFPVSLRRRFKTEEYDFENLKSGTVAYKDEVFIVFGVERKSPADSDKAQ